MSLGGSVPEPKKQPAPPIQADASIREAGMRAADPRIGYESFISTTASGLKRKNADKKSLIGGS